VIKDARAHHFFTTLYPFLYYADFLQHDQQGMESEMARRGPAASGPAGFEANIAVNDGRLAKARQLWRQGAASAERADRRENAAQILTRSAITDALVGNGALATQAARAALALASDREAEGGAGIALALAGDSTQPARLAADLNARFPEDSFVQFLDLPEIHAALALRAGDGSKAVDALSAAAPYDFAPLAQGGPIGYPVYLRGQALLAARDGASAAREFQKIIDHPTAVVQTAPLGALAHLGLARALALSGDAAKAKAAYQDFFALWKNADPDIPVLAQAKAEYAKLPGKL